LSSKSLCRACIKHRASIRRRNPSYYTVERERERERKKRRGRENITDTMSTDGAIFCFPELEKPTSKTFRIVGDSAASPRHRRELKLLQN
jgi:hypothetical protein